MSEQSIKKQEEQKKATEREARERALDKTIADSFPTSDPPSTIPDPVPDSTGGAKTKRKKVLNSPCERDKVKDRPYSRGVYISNQELETIYIDYIEQREIINLH